MTNLKALLTPFCRAITSERLTHIVNFSGELVGEDDSVWTIKYFNEDLIRGVCGKINSIDEIYAAPTLLYKFYDFSEKGKLLWKREKPKETNGSRKFEVELERVDEVAVVKMLHGELMPESHTRITIASVDKKLRDILTQHISDVVKYHFDIKFINGESQATKR